MKIDLREIVKRAYVAGFSASAQGYNGEHPFDQDEGRISREVSEIFQDWFDLELLAQVEVEE